MSERWTWELGDDGHQYVYDRQTHSQHAACEVAEELNRLAAQVETLRELLKELRQCTDRTAWNKAILKNIDAALADTETTG